MKRFLAFTLVVALVLIGLPAPLAAAATPQANGQISGAAKDNDQRPLPNTVVRLRNVANGQLVGATRTNTLGEFSFTGLGQGTYVIEIVDAAGKIIGTSAQISLAAGTMAVSGVAITATAAGAAAAAGGGAFFASTAGVVLIVAAGAGVATGIYLAKRSPKKYPRTTAFRGLVGTELQLGAVSCPGPGFRPAQALHRQQRHA